MRGEWPTSRDGFFEGDILGGILNTDDLVVGLAVDIFSRCETRRVKAGLQCSMT